MGQVVRRLQSDAGHGDTDALLVHLPDMMNVVVVRHVAGGGEGLAVAAVRRDAVAAATVNTAADRPVVSATSGHRREPPLPVEEQLPGRGPARQGGPRSAQRAPEAAHAHQDCHAGKANTSQPDAALGPHGHPHSENGPAGELRRGALGAARRRDPEPAAALSLIDTIMYLSSDV